MLLFLSLVALIFFLDHLAHSIQIDRLMASIQRATIGLINQETVHPRPLLQIAEQLQATVQIAPMVGEHVVAGRPIAHTGRTSPEQTPPDPAALAGAVQDAVRIGYQRTLQQDARFGMRQLVDIALRALSPAVNDPCTAIQAIYRLSVLLCVLTPRPLGDYQINGSGNEARVIIRAQAAPLLTGGGT